MHCRDSVRIKDCSNACPSKRNRAQCIGTLARVEGTSLRGKGMLSRRCSSIAGHSLCYPPVKVLVTLHLVGASHLDPRVPVGLPVVIPLRPKCTSSPLHPHPVGPEGIPDSASLVTRVHPKLTDPFTLLLPHFYCRCILSAAPLWTMANSTWLSIADNYRFRSSRWIQSPASPGSQRKPYCGEGGRASAKNPAEP